ncbi:hypothetical protein BH11MYX1_BH11MYX1_40100 [soil metagenome]
MIRWFAILAALPACDVVFRVDHLAQPDRDATTGDAHSSIDAGCDGTRVGKFGRGATGMVTVCIPSSAPTFELSAIDTNDPSCLDSNNVCVITGTTITLDSMQITGDHSLVIAAATEIDVGGVVDLTHETVMTQDCPGAASGVAATPISGGGGGGGGGWSSEGGAGGNGLQSSGGSGANASPLPTMLRGGCAGATGGNGDTSSGGGFGGQGGSAIYLTAPKIVLGTAASINASGHGGAGGTHGISSAGAGGGGGGSGGLIVFDATSITAAGSGRYVANGGGGGGGGGGLSGDGQPGGTARAPNYLGVGGLAPNTVASAGANGGSGTAPGVGATMATGRGGGGGGGGGQGWILYYSQAELTGLTASPPLEHGL